MPGKCDLGDLRLLVAFFNNNDKKCFNLDQSPHINQTDFEVRQLHVNENLFQSSSRA